MNIPPARSDREPGTRPDTTAPSGAGSGAAGPDSGAAGAGSGAAGPDSGAAGADSSAAGADPRTSDAGPRASDDARISGTLAQVSIIYAAILLGAVLFHAAAWLVHEFGAMDPITQDLFLPLAIDLGAAVGCIVMARVQYARLCASAADAPELTVKLRGWTTAGIVRLAILDAALIVNALALVFTGSVYFALIFLAELAVLLSTRPSDTKLRTELRLPTGTAPIG